VALVTGEFIDILLEKLVGKLVYSESGDGLFCDG
jgi:hypothetical protein